MTRFSSRPLSLRNSHRVFLFLSDDGSTAFFSFSGTMLGFSFLPFSRWLKDVPKVSLGRMVVLPFLPPKRRDPNPGRCRFWVPFSTCCEAFLEQTPFPRRPPRRSHSPPFQCKERWILGPSPTDFDMILKRRGEVFSREATGTQVALRL